MSSPALAIPLFDKEIVSRRFIFFAKQKGQPRFGHNFSSKIAAKVALSVFDEYFSCVHINNIIVFYLFLVILSVLLRLQIGSWLGKDFSEKAVLILAKLFKYKAEVFSKSIIKESGQKHFSIRKYKYTEENLPD